MNKRRGGLSAAAFTLLTGAAIAPASAQSLGELRNMSIEQLAQIDVSSVSKRPQSLADAPASVYVIDHDAIVRSGAQTIPEMLRLAPNLQVYQEQPGNWVVTARGLNGRLSTQSFSNKLLVLVDGRTVYTPLFSGVYWDLPDVLPDDVERIEVVSGPGATLWGANAVNGVINIITRSAAATASGAYVDAEGGALEQTLGARLAGELGPRLTYRAYVRWLHENAYGIPDDGSAEDPWRRLGGGFRLDWTPTEQDGVTLQGDIFQGTHDQAGPGSEDVSGRNLVLRWNRAMAHDQQLQVQAYYDDFLRDSRPDNGSFFVDTYDVDMQHSFALGARHRVVWGGGARVSHYRIDGTPSLFFVPNSRNLFLANAFVQDTFALSKRASVTAGLKAEHDPYVGTSLLPDVRLSLKPAESVLLWAAVSHAVRSATPFDEDVQERVPGVTLTGNRDFRTEKLTAYELGVRAQPLSILSFSLTGFYDHYNDLRTIEIGPGPGLNLHWGNALAGPSYGVEAWGSVKPLPWWTLSAGAMLLRENFHFKSDATAPSLGTSQDGADPGHRFTLESSMDLGRFVALDLYLRSFGRLKDSDVPGYTELNGRLGWNVSPHLTLSVSGENLLHAHHVEYPGGDAIPRRVLAGLQWRP
jgi:iron complex outermembrane receptor protein